MSKETAEVLRQARDLIADPARWTQRTGARSRYGTACSPDSKDAACWCALGAIERVCEDDLAQRQAREVLRHAVVTIYGVDITASDVNDHMGHAAILRVLDHAIANAEMMACALENIRGCKGKCGGRAPDGYEYCIGCAHGAIALLRIMTVRADALLQRVVAVTYPLTLEPKPDLDDHPAARAVSEICAKARADYMAIAQALGRVYEADGHNPEPAPIEDVLRAIRDLNESAARTAAADGLADAIRPIVRDDGTGNPNNEAERKIDALCEAVKFATFGREDQIWAERLNNAMADMLHAIADENASLEKALRKWDAAVAEPDDDAPYVCPGCYAVDEADRERGCDRECDEEAAS